MMVNPNKSTIRHSSVLSTYITIFWCSKAIWKPWRRNEQNQPPCFCFGLRTPKGHEAMPKCRQLPGSFMSFARFFGWFLHPGDIWGHQKMVIFYGGYHGQKIGITLGQSLDFNMGKIYHQQLAQWLHTQPRPSMEINMKPPLNNMIDTYPYYPLRSWSFPGVGFETSDPGSTNGTWMHMVKNTQKTDVTPIFWSRRLHDIIRLCFSWIFHQQNWRSLGI